MNRYACETDVEGRLSSLWSRPRPMTPEQLLHVLIEEHAAHAERVLFSGHPISTAGQEQTAALIAQLDDLLPQDDKTVLESDLLRLFARLCQTVFSDRQLVPPDRAMLDRMVDFACRNGLFGPSTPGHFWLAVKSTLAMFNKIFSAHRPQPEAWGPAPGILKGPTVHHGTGLREDFWEYVVLGAERPERTASEC